MRKIRLSPYYKGLQQYQKNLEQRIAFLEKRQQSLPNVYLKYQIRKSKISYYIRKKGKNNKPSYVRLQNQDQILDLSNIWYIQRVLPKLKKNLEATNKFLKTHSKCEEYDIAQIMPYQLQENNSNLFVSRQVKISAWQSHPYTRNPYKPEGLIHDTARGEKVRSKSEVLIADCLFEYKLAYKPESPLRLKKSNKTIYPDFTIIHPESLKEIYWEHFGMMDNPEYAREATAKINALSQEGLFIGENLICTFETSDLPLTRGTIETYIKKYFLTTTL